MLSEEAPLLLQGRICPPLQPQPALNAPSTDPPVRACRNHQQISRDLPSCRIVTNRAETHPQPENRPCGALDALRTVRHRILLVRLRAAPCGCQDNSFCKTRYIDARLVISHPYTASDITPIFWVRSTSTWYPPWSTAFQHLKKGGSQSSAPYPKIGKSQGWC